MTSVILCCGPLARKDQVDGYLVMLEREGRSSGGLLCLFEERACRVIRQPGTSSLQVLARRRERGCPSPYVSSGEARPGQRSSGLFLLLQPKRVVSPQAWQAIRRRRFGVLPGDCAPPSPNIRT